MFFSDFRITILYENDFYNRLKIRRHPDFPGIPINVGLIYKSNWYKMVVHPHFRNTISTSASAHYRH